MRRPIRLVPMLLLAGGALLLVACGGDETSSRESSTTTTAASGSSTPPSTTSSATTSEATSTNGAGAAGPTIAGGSVTELTGFTSPTGNIGCYIDTTTVRCDIDQRDWQPPAQPASCDLDYGQGIDLEAGGSAAFVCAGDTALRGGGALAYGRSISAGALRCDSAASGMTCTDSTTGHGFTLSKAGYRIS